MNFGRVGLAALSAFRNDLVPTEPPAEAVHRDCIGGGSMLKRGWIALALGGMLLAFAVPAAAQAATEALVNTGSPATPFPQNKQNEPTVAIDPLDPSVAIAGSNDEIDEPRCGGNECPFAQGIGNSGVYFSFNGGTSWTQPTYDGYSGRAGVGSGDTGCTGCGPGPIGTVPNYFEHG